ncbi:adhesion G-protein coupled receptor G6-like [Ptychodera flava]|uniref:adhesion G-protein coupled receptor G6-like n=1 Tax=Ptychodera flava TaxID=63121 RepID=UPI00396A27DD
MIMDDSGLFILWPSQKAGTPAVKQCPQERNNATRLCSYVCSPAGRLQAEWEPPDTSDCSLKRPTRRDRLNNLANLANFASDISREQKKKVLTQLKNLTAEAESFDESDVTISIDVIKSILEGRRRGTEVNVAEIMLRIMDNLLKVDRGVLMAGQRKRKTATRLIKITERLALAVNIGKGFEDTDNTSVTITTPNIYVMVTKVDASEFDGLTFKMSLTEGEVTGQNKEETLITLPTSLFDKLDPAERDLVKRAQFITYKSNTFFRAIDNTTSARLSTVVAASIGDLNITNLTEPVEIKMEHENSSTANGNVTCVFWDFSLYDGRGAWSTEGCAVSSNADDGGNTIVCACNHLTNFAVLVDVYDEAQHFDSANKKALSVVSYIGCGISLLALALALVSLIGCRKRSDKANKILINLCSALFLTLMVFLVDSLVVSFAPIKTGLCTTIAASLHFFLLAVFLWMSLQAVYMYLMLVKVFETYIVHFMVKFCLVGWGIPLVIVVITLSVDVENYGHYSEICWLSRYPFYVALLAPLCLVLIFNSVIYCLVIYQICGLNSKAMTAHERYSYMSQLRAAIGLMVLLGLTWAFAIFAVGEASLVFNYLFAIFNSLQGLFIFVFHCVMKKEIKNGWKKICCRFKTTQYTTTDESGKTNSSSALKCQASETTNTETNLDSSTSTQYHIDSQFERNGRQAQKD